MYDCCKQCAEYTTKEQYDHSHEVLTKFLLRDDTRYQIGVEAAEAALKLQRRLIGKEMYLAHHVRFGVHMSMDTMTTSPVESMNSIVKKNVNSNYNLSKSIKTTTGIIDELFEDHRKLSLWEENIVNCASQSVTKDIIERKAQYLIDQSFDNQLNIKGMHYRKEVWLCWDFREVNTHSKKKGSWR